MSARDEILGRVRTALASADRGPVEVPRTYRARTTTDLVTMFEERVADHEATVRTVGPDQVGAAIADVLAGSRAVVPPALPWDVPGAVVDDGLTATELDALDAVVTAARLGIAETGTIVLDHEPDQGRRALSLVPDLHVCVVRADQVVGTVPEAVAALDPARPLTWISGPSATSDIELSRVEGVHGPRTLVVLLVR
jgi:L-lactate utilization protein LutC